MPNADWPAAASWAEHPLRCAVSALLHCCTAATRYLPVGFFWQLPIVTRYPYSGVQSILPNRKATKVKTLTLWKAELWKAEKSPNFQQRVRHAVTWNFGISPVFSLLCSWRPNCHCRGTDFQHRSPFSKPSRGSGSFNTERRPRWLQLRQDRYGDTWARFRKGRKMLHLVLASRMASKRVSRSTGFSREAAKSRQSVKEHTSGGGPGRQLSGFGC
jgi:hypothetical protein